MLKYGVVGAIALAVLVAAMWDGSKKKKTDEVARTDDTVVTGDIGSGTVTSVEPPRPTPLPSETVDRVVALTNQAPPHQATHWTASAMAKEVE